MSLPNRSPHRIAAVIATACAGLAVASAAEAVDLRSWDQKISDNSKRYIVLASLNNQAVLDKETQLVWQAVAEPAQAAKTWSQAYLGCHSATTGGRRGWRLPTYPEIASVLGPDAVKPTVLNGVPNGAYWSATAYPDNDDYAMTINLPAGDQEGVAHKSNQRRYWCVRGPA